MLPPREEGEQSHPLLTLSEPRGILEYVSWDFAIVDWLQWQLLKPNVFVNKEIDSDVNQTHSREARKKMYLWYVLGIVNGDEVESL